MDELRAAVRALAAEAQRIERHLESCQNPPSKSQLEALQTGVDGIQQRLNRLSLGGLALDLAAGPGRTARA
jgi:hypothetical protein